MSSELDIYKKKLISQYYNTYNKNISILNNNLKNNILKIKQSKISNSQKNSLINNLMNHYNNNVNNLKTILNQNIAKAKSITYNKININGNGKRKALLIGINYIGTQYVLGGCIADINDIKTRINGEGFQNINVLSDYTTVKPTKNNILNALKDLLKSANAGDFLFFAYSGHGSYKADNNNDETTGYDQLICPLDFNMIVDDELKSIIQSNLKQGVTLFAMFDSCFSGTVLDLKYQYIDSLNYDNFTIHDRQLETQGDVFMISGCTDYQTSADAIINGRNNGAMTWSLLNSLKQKPNCTWRELIKNMRNLLKSSKFTQIPQFSCGKLENIDNKVFI
jgi:hypothetical protein